MGPKLMPRPRLSLPVVIMLPAALVPGSDALGDDLSYRSYPLGGRAVGLGGAFTALGNDASGLFYNPAGLVDVSDNAVQVGTNLYGISVQGGITDAFGAVVDVERVVSELDIIPATASGVNVLERDAQGRPVTVYALGSFVPSSRNAQTSVINDLAEEERFPGCATLAYERTVSDRRFLFGGGVGHRLGERWSVGFAGFVAYRALREREEILCSDDSDAVGNPAFSTADTRVNLSAFSIQLNFAAKLRLPEGWTFGANLTTPSIRAFGQAGVRVRRSRSLPEQGETEFLLREIDNARAETEDGLAIRLGVARHWASRGTVSFDLSFFAPTRYELVEVAPQENEVLESLTLTTSIERRAVLNFALGGEYELSPEFTIAGGAFSNFSSAPPIPREVGAGFDEDRLAHIHEIGATLVGGLSTKHNLTRAGFILTYGAGSDVVPRYAGLAALGARNQYVKVRVQQATLFFFLSTTLRY